MGAVEMLSGARWISGPDYTYGEYDAGYYTRERRNHVVSRSFSLEGVGGEVSLAIAVLGYARVLVNGVPLDRIALLGHWTNWTRAVYADLIDITSLVVPGENRIEIELGNGFYNPAPLTLFGKYNLRERLAEVGTPQVLCAVRQGDRVVVSSDDTWNCAEGGLLFNNVYLGEVRDARCPRGAELALTVRENRRRLEGNPAPLCRAFDGVDAIEIRERDGVAVIDFGRTIEGFFSCAIQGSAGQEVTFRYAEFAQDGKPNFETNVAGHVGMKTPRGICPGGPSAPVPAEQRDALILRDGVTEFENVFTYHSFRFVEVSGAGSASIVSAVAVPVHNDVAPASEFWCDSSDLMALYDAARLTKLNNMHDVFEDCSRERFGYGGDMVALATSNLFMFNLDGMLDKTLADLRRDQTERGGIPETAPFMGIGSNGPAYGEGPLLWQLAYPYLAVKLDQYCDARGVLGREWPGIERFGDYLLSFDPAELAPHCLGDHGSMLTGENFKGGTPDKEFVGWCAILWCLASVAEAARRLGCDASRFADAAERLRGEIRTRFMHEDGTFGDGTQTALAFAGALGLGDPARLADRLADAIERNGSVINCGIFGTMLAFELLGRTRHHDVLERWLSRREAPCLLGMLENGGVLVENFEGFLASYDHAMFSSYAQWFYQGLAGIWVAERARACDAVTIRPHFSPLCDAVRCSYATPQGELAVAWTRKDGSVEVEVAVPEGIDADIEIPGAVEVSHSVESGVERMGFAVECRAAAE